MKFVITQLFALSRHFVLFGPVLHTEPFSRKSYCIRCFLKAVRHCCVYSQNQQITHEHAVYCNLYQQPHVSVILITIVGCTEENNCKLRRHLGLLQLILLKVNIKLAWEISGAFTGFFFPSSYICSKQYSKFSEANFFVLQVKSEVIPEQGSSLLPKRWVLFAVCDDGKLLVNVADIPHVRPLSVIYVTIKCVF